MCAMNFLTSQNKDKSVVLFDGVCNLCSAGVLFIIRRNSGRCFQFAALQSDAGKKILKNFGLPENFTESIIFIENNKIYFSSTGALRIARHLNFPWPICYIFILIPPFIRNLIYDIIAKNRYQWFGKKENCMVPDENLRKYFQD